jgi:hypothetical protein
MTDALQLKEKIMALIQSHGPTLPVFIASQTGLSIIFSSAFLSELIADKRLKISDMRVGSSPLYFIPGQEPLLENFSQYLKSKEKDAFMILKEKKFLKDKDLDPAIRVALRGIRDFAIAFKRNDDIYWRYFTTPEMEFRNIEESKPLPVKEIIIEKEEISAPVSGVIVEEVKPIEVVEEVISLPEEAKKIAKKTKVKKQPKKDSKKNNFFNKVKEFLSQRQIEILSIEEIGINKIIFKVRNDGEYLIIAYNKKKISEQDVVNSHKKSVELDLPYKILLLGEPMKRFENLIKAARDLKGIEKIE